jgi:hypothetical protein
MTMRLRVEWPNADHALLPEALAKIEVKADGAALTALVTNKGVREFELPTGTAKVELRATFSAKLRAVGNTPEQQHQVLFARQEYEISAAGVVSILDMPPWFQPHPLVDSKALANANVGILARIRTEFVDIHEFWRAYCATDQLSLDERDLYDADTHPDARFRALGFTAGAPLIWLASYPHSVVRTTSADVSCLVYFRPANENYTRVDQKHSMFRPNRFLLAGVAGDPNPDRADRFISPNYVWLRTAFERALVQAGKPVVLLQPWPSGTNVGLATTNRLPELAFGALRRLWTLNEIALDTMDIRLGRLGISGYSAGGTALWRALANNMETVREVFSFDANGTAANAGNAVRWFKKHPDNRLRMSGGLQIGANVGIENSIADTSGRVTVVPKSAREYIDATIPQWKYCTELQPQLRSDAGAWHQFAMFGAFPGVDGPQTTCVLQQFLELSGF